MDHGRGKTEAVRRPASLAFLLVILMLVITAVALCGCDETGGSEEAGGSGGSGSEAVESSSAGTDADDQEVAESGVKVLIGDVPEWSGKPYIVINDNVPEFSRNEIKHANAKVRKGKRCEHFSELDRRGRCGRAFAVVSRSTIPDGERGSIGMVRPSGWRLDKYDFIDNGGYLYNRCHLIGWQLTGQNEEERNLITGTRYLNVEGMLPFENEVAEYIKTSGAHVLYRATPVFRGKERVARGVQLEAYSLEDKGAGLSFNVYCYNVQPGVKINYRNGKNKPDPGTMPEGAGASSEAGETTDEAGSGKNSAAAGDKEKDNNEYPPLDIPDGVTYILNKNTMRFHRTGCKGTRTIREHNREWFYGTREEAVDAGYIPCGICEP